MDDFTVTINRTKVELKQELKKLKEALFASINRTKVELKHAITGQ